MLAYFVPDDPTCDGTTHGPYRAAVRQSVAGISARRRAAERAAAEQGKQRDDGAGLRSFQSFELSHLSLHVRKS